MSGRPTRRGALPRENTMRRYSLTVLLVTAASLAGLPWPSAPTAGCWPQGTPTAPFGGGRWHTLPGEKAIPPRLDPIVSVKVVVNNPEAPPVKLPTIVVDDAGRFTSIDNVLLGDKAVSNYFRRSERDKKMKDSVFLRIKDPRMTSVATLFSAVEKLRRSAESGTDNEILILMFPE